MKILVISDVHGTDFWKTSIEKIDKYDYIVQTGDWFDDWNNDWDKVNQIDNLNKALEFQKKYSQKVHILIGNHDLNSYLMGEYVSGHQNDKANDICSFLKSHYKQMKIAVEIGGYVFSHAGFTNTWMKQYYFENIEQVNKSYLNREWKPFRFDGWDSTGDDVTQGPTWVRPWSLIKDAYFKKQVVGHTPIKKPPLIYEKDGLSIYFVDCGKHDFQYEMEIL